MKTIQANRYWKLGDVFVKWRRIKNCNFVTFVIRFTTKCICYRVENQFTEYPFKISFVRSNQQNGKATIPNLMPSHLYKLNSVDDVKNGQMHTFVFSICFRCTRGQISAILSNMLKSEESELCLNWIFPPTSARVGNISAKMCSYALKRSHGGNIVLSHLVESLIR